MRIYVRGLKHMILDEKVWVEDENGIEWKGNITDRTDRMKTESLPRNTDGILLQHGANLFIGMDLEDFIDYMVNFEECKEYLSAEAYTG